MNKHKWIAARSGRLSFLFLCILLFFSFRCTTEKSLSVRYTSSFEKIILEDQKLTIIQMKHHYPPNHPQVAVPDSISAIVLTDHKFISGKKIAGLKELLTNSGFWDLENSYGAPEGQRYYPYELEVELDGRSKRVTYRSNPEYEQPPPIFEQLKKKLSALAR